jgi:hypothetical protein
MSACAPIGLVAVDRHCADAVGAGASLSLSRRCFSR